MKSLRTPHIVTLVAAVVVIASLVLLRFPAQSAGRQGEELAVARATRTATPTSPPPTNTPTHTPTSTPTSTPTEVPPTATPVPPTETPVPPTNTPEPTRVPPTAVPVPPTPVPQPVDIVSSIELPNVEGGNGVAVVNYEGWGETTSFVTVKAGDGHTYRGEIGFLNRPESIQRAQEYWSYAQRGGGAWSWIIRLRKSPNWISCGSDRNVCYEGKDNSTMLQVNSELYLKGGVWESLVNDWLAGGWVRVAQNPHYGDIQRGVFKYVIDLETIDTPIIGFRFTRLD